jgi:glycosyltransferase involved in cell wall biosynthesis
MAATVARALRDREYRESLETAGRAIACGDHHPARVSADYYRHIEAVAAEKSAVQGPMRLALDLRWMVPGLAGGLENLARSFLSHLLQLDRYNRYTLLLPARCLHDFDLRGHGNVRARSVDSARESAARALRRAVHLAHTRLRLDHWESPEVLSLRFLRSLEADIAYSLPGYIQPDLYPLRQVLVVPDIQHEYFPEFFPGPALEERRRVYGASIARADHLCAISEFTRQSLIERLGVNPDKVTTVLLAADPRFTPEEGAVPDAVRLARYGLQPGGYVYFPAHTWHHKNHKAAVAALRVLRDRHNLSVQLVCTGGSREAQPAIEEQVRELDLVGQVRFLGYVPVDDLPVLYRGAVCLLYPSLFEGFGMPVLEAMACGCPVVCSNTSSLPEIAGDAALLEGPRDVEALARAVARLWSDKELRGLLRRRGLIQAARFSWERHTMETIAVFHRTHRQMKPCGGTA